MFRQSSGVVAQPAIQSFRGLSISQSLAKHGKLQEALNFVPSKNDIILSSYPNYGTVWMEYIVWEIVNAGRKADTPSMYDMMTKHFPYLELTGTRVLRNMTEPRLVQVHLPYNYLRYTSDARYIYVARNPKDCLVSYYLYHKELPEWFGFEQGTFDDFFHCFITGRVAYGDYFGHVMSFFERKNKANVMFVTYEELKIDHPGILYDVAEFLGEEYYLQVKYNEDTFRRISEATTFDHLKDMQLMAAIDDGITTEDLDVWDKVDAVSRGEVGDWRKYLSDEQNRVIERLMENTFEGTYLYHLWSDNN